MSTPIASLTKRGFQTPMEQEYKCVNQGERTFGLPIAFSSPMRCLSYRSLSIRYIGSALAVQEPVHARLRQPQHLHGPLPVQAVRPHPLFQIETHRDAPICYI